MTPAGVTIARLVQRRGPDGEIVFAGTLGAAGLRMEREPERTPDGAPIWRLVAMPPADDPGAGLDDGHPKPETRGKRQPRRPNGQTARAARAAAKALAPVEPAPAATVPPVSLLDHAPLSLGDADPMRPHKPRRLNGRAAKEARANAKNPKLLI